MPEIRSKWYVIQVRTGHEERARALISQAAAQAAEGGLFLAADAADAAGVASAVGFEGAASAAGLKEAASGLRAASAAGILRECFVPKACVAQKVDGKWIPCERVLLPGYLIAVTARADQLEPVLRRVPDLTRILGNDNAFTPLDASEVAWLEASTSQSDRVVEMSEGCLEGGRLRITSGPLLGKEAWVRKVNHRKKVAYLEMQMFGRTIKAQLGLKVKRKRV
ncbi:MULTISPECIES: transcription termination/antitermination NusG family protein [unclassified Adlercreutzia]|uniref:transcription termination/antitermination NusG family protein n=1 Tax=unclassified Adlercreutzia TaxID=2636013 RepID=UPI0013EB0C8C|nr:MULTISPECIES: transcription termination/antitermination NusG family protein [unclassified Adlercreutzia]